MKHSSRNQKQAIHEVLLEQHYIFHILDHCLGSISMFLHVYLISTLHLLGTIIDE
jgi:hypothetical protein